MIAVFAALFPEGLEHLLQKMRTREAKKDQAENETKVAAANDPPAAEKPQEFALLQKWLASRSIDEKIACVVINNFIGSVCNEAEKIICENLNKWRDELCRTASFQDHPHDAFAQGLVIGMEINQE